MTGFLAPAWLAALGALAVPLAIHLWSHRPRRPIRVGSIRLLAAAPPAAARALRLRDPWLLLLRLGVLAALVLSLARPWWARAGAREGRWALLSPEALADRALLDSLREAGAELRLLEGGIPLLADGSLQMVDGRRQMADGRGDGADCHLPNATCHYWSLLSEADRLAPPGTRFVVAAPLLANRFRGVRPTIGAPVTWRDVEAETGGRADRPTGGHAVREVAIVGDAVHRDDARYVEAAIRAAAAATGLPAEVRRGEPGAAGDLVARADWIVWLAGGDPPPEVAARTAAGAVLLALAGRDTAAAHATPVVLAATAPNRPALARRAPFDGAGAPVWTDGRGEPLLSVTRAGDGLAYRLYARVHPAAGDLALSPAFPEAMAALWVATAAAGAAAGDVRIARSQALPRAGPAARSGGAMPPGARPLATPLFAVAALAFVLERWLAWRRSREPA